MKNTRFIAQSGLIALLNARSVFLSFQLCRKMDRGKRVPCCRGYNYILLKLLFELLKLVFSCGNGAYELGLAVL